ncbi:retropepsin-like aspartic protease family protein [Sphingomonas sp. RS2018]
MTDDTVSLLWGVGALALVISALTARRLSFREILRSLIGWAIIAGIAWAVIANRDRIEPMVAGIGERLGIGAQTVEGETVRITMSADGHFWARVRLNDHTERMLIDSGATITALTPRVAQAAGVEVSEGGFPVMINTANGTITARRATAGRVAIGGLKTRDLGVIVSPAFGEMNVIGMNFLSRLGSWRVEGRTLILEPKRPDAH